MLSDGDLVRNLLGRYCERLDAGDFAGVGALFASGRLTSDGAVLATGAEEVAEFYRRGTLLHGETPRTKHLVVDTVLEPSADGATIEARSSYLVLQAIEGSQPLQPIIAGRYVDTFTATDDGGWIWAERAFAVDLLGDLSQHLAFQL
ncbi:MAG: nuclear transport factor 2 family protein [Acidimicrobiales bacterium]